MACIRDASRRDVLVGADADVIDTDDVGHLLEALDVSVKAREEVPDANRATGFGDGSCIVGADLPGPSVVSGPSRATPVWRCATTAGVRSRP